MFNQSFSVLIEMLGFNTSNYEEKRKIVNQLKRILFKLQKKGFIEKFLVDIKTVYIRFGLGFIELSSDNDVNI